VATGQTPNLRFLEHANMRSGSTIAVWCRFERSRTRPRSHGLRRRRRRRGQGTVIWAISTDTPPRRNRRRHSARNGESPYVPPAEPEIDVPGSIDDETREAGRAAMRKPVRPTGSRIFVKSSWDSPKRWRWPKPAAACGATSRNRGLRPGWPGNEVRNGGSGIAGKVKRRSDGSEKRRHPDHRRP
jgi:hypothetical protein